ncbi:hypothetical protein MTR_2g069790 [Medicago truncatula]|uniref:Uncharacterized protein n=1 Tax=Medicago truncatula TaxID=3880 RepID=A0A072V8P7_MEDTR|nr:hypothetical protein MTR_2g069790 [Medicago truncatula]
MKNGSNDDFVEMMFDSSFYMDLSVFSCLETFRQTLGSNLGIMKSKLGFWGENGFSREQNSNNLSQLAMASWRRVGSKWEVLPVCQLAMASDSLVGASCTVTTSPVSRSCVFFTHFCFELAFGLT